MLQGSKYLAGPGPFSMAAILGRLLSGVTLIIFTVFGGDERTMARGVCGLLWNLEVCDVDYSVSICMPQVNRSIRLSSASMTKEL